MKSGQQGLV